MGAARVDTREVLVQLRPATVFDTRKLSVGAVPTQATPDLDQLTRAVRALVQAIAPGLVAEVTVRTTDETGPDLVSTPPPPVAVDDDDQADVRIDRLSRTLFIDDEPTRLTRREFELMEYLYVRRGVALGRRELMTAVWRERYLPGDRTIDVHVRRLRVKLGRHADRLSTLRGYGYRFD